MTEIDYKPKANFEGYVRIKMPRYKERIALLRSMNYKPIQSESGITAETTNDGLVSAEKMAEVVEAHVVKVDLKHIQTGIIFTSLEQLECYKEGAEVLAEVNSVIFNGVALGNG